MIEDVENIRQSFPSNHSLDILSFRVAYLEEALTLSYKVMIERVLSPNLIVFIEFSNVMDVLDLDVGIHGTGIVVNR